MQSFIETLAAQLTLGADPVRGSLNQVGLLQTSDRLRLVSTRLREASSIGVTVVKESNDLAPAPEKRPQRKITIHILFLCKEESVLLGYNLTCIL